MTDRIAGAKARLVNALVVSAALGAAGCGFAGIGGSRNPFATATLYDANGATLGTAEFREKSDHTVAITVAANIPAGTHGIHIHAVGSCTAPAFTSAGGHFNPVVSLVDAAFGRRDALAYIPAQIAGCIAGAVVANGMFALSAISISTHHRASPAHLRTGWPRSERCHWGSFRSR